MPDPPDDDDLSGLPPLPVTLNLAIECLQEAEHLLETAESQEPFPGFEGASLDHWRGTLRAQAAEALRPLRDDPGYAALCALCQARGLSGPTAAVLIAVRAGIAVVKGQTVEDAGTMPLRDAVGLVRAGVIRDAARAEAPAPRRTGTPTDSDTEATAGATGGERSPEPPARGPSADARPQRRGRRKGEDYIATALVRLTARMKDGLPVDIPATAKDVGCSQQNLRQSERFMSAYRMLIQAQAPLKGSKSDGIVEAEDDEDNF